MNKAEKLLHSVVIALIKFDLKWREINQPDKGDYFFNREKRRHYYIVSINYYLLSSVQYTIVKDTQN